MSPPSDHTEMWRLFRESRLRQVVTQRRAILLVGAGFSLKKKKVPGGLGSDIAWQLLTRIKEHESNSNNHDIDDSGLRSSDLSLSRIAQRYEKTFGTGELHSTVLYHCREYLHNHPEDQHKLLAMLDPFRFIITTNWDHLIEDAFRMSQNTQRRKFQTVCNTQELRNVIGRSRTVLIKLNGNLKRQWSGWAVNPRITTREMFSLEKEEPGLWEFVRAVFVAHIPIIVGFNPHDRNLIELLSWREEVIGGAADIARPFLIDPNEAHERDLPVKISYVKATGAGFMKYMSLLDSLAGGETRVWAKNADEELGSDTSKLYSKLRILQSGPAIPSGAVSGFPTQFACLKALKPEFDQLGLSARLGSKLYQKIERVDVVGTDKDVGPDVLRKAVAKRASSVVKDILKVRSTASAAMQVPKPVRISLSCGRTIQDVISATSELLDTIDLEILSTTLTLIDESDLTSSSGLVARYVQQVSDLAGTGIGGHFSSVQSRVSGIAPRLSTVFAKALVSSSITEAELGDLNKEISILRNFIRDSENISDRLSPQGRQISEGDQAAESTGEVVSPGRTAIVVRDHIKRVRDSDVVLLGVGPLLSKNSTFQRYAGACARSCSDFVNIINNADVRKDSAEILRYRSRADQYAAICVRALHDVLGTFGEATYKPFLLRTKVHAEKARAMPSVSGIDRPKNWFYHSYEYVTSDFDMHYKSGMYEMDFLRPCDVFVPVVLNGDDNRESKYLDIDKVNGELQNNEESGFGSYSFDLRKELWDSILDNTTDSEQIDLATFAKEFYARMFMHTCGPTAEMLHGIISGESKGKIILIASGADKAMPSLGIIGLGICTHLIADESCASRMAELLAD